MEEKNIPQIPADFYQEQLILPLMCAIDGDNKEEFNGIIHKDFILTHPSGRYAVCGHKISTRDSLFSGRKFCLQPAGMGTGHIGKGYCKYHDIGFSNIKTGKYSKFLKEDLLQKVEEFRDDPQILSLNEEIYLMRGILAELLTISQDLKDLWLVNQQKLTIEGVSKENLEEFKAAADSFKKKYIHMLSDIQDSIEKLSKIIETKNKLENGEKYTIHIDQVNVIISQITNIIQKYVISPETLFKIGKDLQNIKIPTIEN